MKRTNKGEEKEKLDGASGLRNSKDEQARRSLAQPDQDFYAESSCSKRFKTEELRKYLFAIKAGNKGNPRIRQHLEDACAACAVAVQTLRATEPFLRGERSKRLTVYARIIGEDKEQPSSRDQRELALQELTDALMRVIFSRSNAPSEKEVDRLEKQFFSRLPGGLREHVAAQCLAIHHRIPRAMRDRIQGLWVSVVDDLASAKETIDLKLNREEAAAFRLWALGQKWMLAASRAPWEQKAIRRENLVQLVIHRDWIAGGVETAKVLWPTTV